MPDYDVSLFKNIVQVGTGFEDQEEKPIKCVICQYRVTEAGTTTVMLTRGETTVVIHEVPAHTCTISGEEYVDVATGRRLPQIAESPVNEGVQEDVRRFKFA